MKRKQNLYDSVSMEDIISVYRKQIRVNTKNKYKIKRFEDFYSINISRVKRTFENANYGGGEYNIFLIQEPKYRIIMSQNIYDKLINHVVATKFLLPVLDKSLIEMNIATRLHKGMHFGIKKVKKYLNFLKGETVYALKYDISKYFYNIDHKILMNLLYKKFKDKKALDMLLKIINSTDREYVNKTIEKLKSMEFEKINNLNISEKEKSLKIKEIEQIPLYKKGKGLPIGNMTSQILAVFYLNELDHFIKENLGAKYYIRYMDDGVIFSNDKKYLKFCLEKIEEVVKKYKLCLNKKTKIINVSKEGLDFLGFRFLILNNKMVLKVRKFTKKRFKRKMKLARDGKILPDKALRILSSYKGLLKWGNCYMLMKENLSYVAKATNNRIKMSQITE